MKYSELVEKLKDAYHNSERGMKAVNIHLFGIDYAKDLQGHNLKELCKAATGYQSYEKEIRKAINLAEFVVRK